MSSGCGANPTDPLENFVDKWAEHPERAKPFFEWLQKARTEFAQAARSNDRKLITETVGRGVGGSLADRAARRRQPPARPALLKTASVAPACGIRGKAATDSDGRRPPIPIESGHPIRTNAATLLIG
ncbi:hypothetical protein [Bradyrhizobium sp. 87]|uniref:hypothetical protein n=1 Tax=Bradyrhizobium sp. 87 TaxID=2782682 RepID=UPI001FF8A0EE|nr:hypothetical protein [Bradyrhizobium sp. 87]MCK1426081.1 hypothetical protein [Bradyrhizobium sp. 87]